MTSAGRFCPLSSSLCLTQGGASLALNFWVWRSRETGEGIWPKGKVVGKWWEGVSVREGSDGLPIHSVPQSNRVCEYLPAAESGKSWGLNDSKQRKFIPGYHSWTDKLSHAPSGTQVPSTLWLCSLCLPNCQKSWEIVCVCPWVGETSLMKRKVFVTADHLLALRIIQTKDCSSMNSENV